MKRLEDYIQVVPGVLTKKDCAAIIKKLNESEAWAPAVIGDAGRANTNVRNCDMIQVSLAKSAHKELMDVDALLFAAAGKALQGYVNATEANVLIQMDTGYDALRYKKGGFYLTHVDHMTTQHRSVSCSFMLNDNYEGGEWAFFGEEFKIKAPVGSAVLFPSNFCYPHQILPVAKGTRYSVVTWFI